MAAATLLHGETTGDGQAIDVTLFESGDRAGGHANTVEVSLDGVTYALDTGFMVFNERTYPVFIDLLQRWGVASQPSDMSFGVSSERTGLEYAGTGLAGLFAQPSNLVSAAHWRMLADIARFARVGRRLLRERDDTTTIGELLASGRWSKRFVDEYLLALGSAIWSCDPRDFAEFPARALAAFLDNHGLLTLLDRPPWRTIVGGSQSYVNAAVRELGGAVRAGSDVHNVRRMDHGAEITTSEGAERFDHVVLAVHADTALDLLVDASPVEKELLGAFAYEPNDVVLHHDPTMLPRSRRAWASWNHHRGASPASRVQVTYHLNRLLDIEAPHQFCVTLNRTDDIDPSRVLWRGTMSHPLYNTAAFAAQRRWREISGVTRTHYCGAYWGWGFHEDGAASGKRVAEALLAATPTSAGTGRGR
ncbi:MAG: FAD-dependent oxidoreductase [Acidimicrobiales bacterium]|nr:FAD-dependent oxidoreductase [Acidimicrobiales bacterium]